MKYSLDNINVDQMTPESLGELLVEAKKAYYTTGRPLMDDHTYDTLEAILRQIAPYHRLFSTVGTPNFDTGFPKKPHTFPMYSQNKVTNEAQLFKYFELKKIPSDSEFIVQPKCDGLSLELIYQNGTLIEVITRGDGRVGDLVTQNVVKMKNFKNNLDNFSGSVRAEIVVTQADFSRLNQISSDSYSNPRNAASGISQRLDGKYSEFCSLYVWDLIPSSITLSTEKDKYNLANSLGLVTVETDFVISLNQVDSIYQKYLSGRDKYPFEIDGLVIKINDLSIQNRLGVLDNRPKGQVAYKFPAASNQSRILNVTWQVGPLGNITPVARIEPVTVSGALITNISLANASLIEEKNVNVGDIVEISRRGDVIPHLEKVITKVTKGSVVPPADCPACRTPLVLDHKFLKCPNHLTCPAQRLGVLRLFCQTLDIKGISDKTIIKLNAVGRLNLPGDFYMLTIADFSDLEGLGKKSGANIIREIQSKRRLTPSQVFDAANIPNFSRKRIDLLINAGYNTPKKLLNLTVDQIAPLKGFQVTLAQKIVEGIQTRIDVINSILAQVELVNPTTPSGQKLTGLKFAITGTLTRPRSHYENTIDTHGGEVQSSVTSATSYLLTNDPASSSSKFIAAQKLGVKIINDSDFEELLK